jgi:hypothetical protein
MHIVGAQSSPEIKRHAASDWPTKAEAIVWQSRSASLSIIDLNGAADVSDGTLNSISGFHPSRSGHLLCCAEARVSNVAIIYCRPRVQHDRSLGGYDPHRLGTGHVRSCRSLLGYSARGKTRRHED